jgi:hypothetical protein
MTLLSISRSNDLSLKYEEAVGPILTSIDSVANFIFLGPWTLYGWDNFDYMEIRGMYVREINAPHQCNEVDIYI